MIRRALTNTAAAILIYTITRIPLPHMWESHDDWDDNYPEEQPYLIHETDYIDDLL